MRWRKALRVTAVVAVVIFAILFVPLWFFALRPPTIKYRFLNEHPMVRHGLLGSMSTGPNHGWEWAIYAWKGSFSTAVNEAKTELVGWHVTTSSPTHKVKYISFDDADHEITIYSMDLPPKGELWRIQVPNPNSVVVEVTQARPDNQYEDVRSRILFSEP